MLKEFLKYVVPSVISFTLAGVYCFVDAYFVGNSVGDGGIAAINIAFSLLAIMQALGNGIGLGSSILYSINKNNIQKAKNYLSVGNLLFLIVSVIITIPLSIYSYSFLKILGASDNIAKLGESYFKIVSYGSFFQIVGTGLVPVVRNCGGNISSMIAMVSGLGTNIFLDWLFVDELKMGMNGAAWATFIAQVLAFVICFVYLVFKKKLYLKIRNINLKSYIKDIIKVGISPFGLVIVPNISVIIINRACLKYGGDVCLSAYGCIAYIIYIIALVIQGIDDGAQPLVSTYYGIKNTRCENIIKKYMYITSFITSIILGILCFIYADRIGKFMGASFDTSVVIKKGLPIFLIGIPCFSITRTASSILYAKNDNLYSYIISYIEPLFILIFITFLPKLFGVSGIWLSNTVGQVCVLLTTLLILLKKRMKQ